MLFLRLLLIALCLTACAAPVSVTDELSPFISRRELLVVSLAQEGMALFNNGRLFESEIRFRKALFLDPSLDNVRFNLAVALEKAGFNAEAQQITANLLQKYPDNYNYHAALARMYKTAADYVNATYYFETAARLASQQQAYNAELNILRSLAALKLAEGKSAEAICQMEQVLQLARQGSLAGGAEIFSQLILVLLSEGKTGKALRMFEQQSSQFYPEDSLPSLYLRSHVFFALHEYDDLLLLTERALILPGSDPVQKFELSIINLLVRYANEDPDLFKLETEQATLLAIKQALSAGSLTSLYWSPELLQAAYEIVSNNDTLLEKFS